MIEANIYFTMREGRYHDKSDLSKRVKTIHERYRVWFEISKDRCSVPIVEDIGLALERDGWEMSRLLFGPHLLRCRSYTVNIRFQKVTKLLDIEAYHQYASDLAHALAMMGVNGIHSVGYWLEIRAEGKEYSSKA